MKRKNVVWVIERRESGRTKWITYEAHIFKCVAVRRLRYAKLNRRYSCRLVPYGRLTK